LASTPATASRETRVCTRCPAMSSDTAGTVTAWCRTRDVHCADCDGDAGADGPIDFGGTDAASLGSQEFVVVVFDFGVNNSAGGFRISSAGAAAGSSISANVSGGFNPGQHAVVGVSAAATDDISTLRCVLRPGAYVRSCWPHTHTRVFVCVCGVCVCCVWRVRGVCVHPLA
jgi:hypothetical protein